MIDDGKREFLTGGAALLAALGLGGPAFGAAKVEPIQGPSLPLEYPGIGGNAPWLKRVFHLWSGPDGLTRAEQLEVVAPRGQAIATLLRRTAVRVTVGGSQPGAGFGFHVANQPTLLIPIFGSMIIGLHDGTEHALRHGDLAYAEDCTGKGHISRSGPDGSFMVSVQLPKEGCPVTGSSDMTKVWSD